MTAEVGGSGASRTGAGRVWGALLVLGLLAAVVWLAMRSGTQAVDRGVTAFVEGRFEEAELWFTEAADGGSRDPAVYLYLGRIQRRTGRPEQAAESLRLAAELDPADADVRRELGYLFLDLGRPAPAAEQFRRAQELDPTEPLAWIGLIRALRAAGSPEADVWLVRAPEEVRSALRADPDSMSR